MKRNRAAFFSAIAVIFYSSGLAEARPLHQVALITCLDGASATVPMRSTERLPEASGTAKVERRGGTTAIEVALDSMKPALLFGGDYNTYVLWVVPPMGPAVNAGEFTLDGSRARLQLSIPIPTFALLVSAEPHFMVTAPSAFVVLESNPEAPGAVVEQPLIEGEYYFARSSLDNVKEAKGKVHSEVRQAFTAVRLAQRAGADALAADEWAQSRQALDVTLALWEQREDQFDIAAQARRTVRLAVAAQRLARERALLETRAATEGGGGGNARPKGAAAGVEAIIGGKR